MVAENARVDTTFIGYFLIGAILLMLGVLGLQHGGVFGDIVPAEGAETSSLPLDYTVSSTICVIVGLALAVLAVLEYRIGAKAATAAFTTFSVGLVSYAILSIGHISSMLAGIEGATKFIASLSWFIFIAIAVFCLIIALYMLIDKASILVAILVIMAAVMFLFIGLMYYFVAAEGFDANVTKIMGILFGVFAFIGFVLATYVGLAYSVPRAKLPIL